MTNRTPWWRTSWVLIPARLVGAATAITLLCVFGWFWWNVVPTLYAPTESNAVATTRTGLLAGLVGIGAIGTLWLNNRTYRVAARTFNLTERGQLTERFIKANELLGEENSTAMKLGGIYALQQLGADTGHSSDQAAVVEVLSAFVRLNFSIDVEPDEWMHGYDPQDAKRGKPGAEILAAVSVLAQLPNRRGVMRADFTGVDLGQADLSDARFQGGDLHGVSLRKAGLYRARLGGMNLRGADLRFIDARFSNFKKAQLQDTKLRKAVLKGADLQGAKLRRAGLTYSSLQQANFQYADLRETKLFEAVLIDADLRGARLDGADFEEVTLRGANIRYTDLRAVRNLTQHQIDSAKGNATTRLPANLTRPESWLSA
jgi:uncharacterized protein YjbI with pentapeptide repeats